MTQHPHTSLSSHFNALPVEIIRAVCSQLSNGDIKSLRLTCRLLRDISHLNFDRVFISANPRNIEVLLAIANHDVFRFCVREIVWDDAVLKDVANKDNDGPSGYSSGESDFEDDAANEDEEIMSRDLTYLCKDAIETSEGRLKGFDNNYYSDDKQHRQLDNLMRSRDSLAYWNGLLKEQEKVLRSGADETAFRYALQRFPRLNKVTVTPATHGFLFTPLHQTPMIRAFPSGFVYPLPRGWPSDEGPSLDDSDGFPDGWENEDERKQWRGVCIVSKVLADLAESLQVSELSLDSHRLPTGIDYTLFKTPNDDYDNLCKIVEQPGFKSITISLITAYISDRDPEDFDFYRNGMISGLLARAPHLESFVYQTDYSHNPGAADEEDIFVSLLDIFPIDTWSTGRLKHFGLQGILVTQNDLVSFLAKLPSTLQSVELSFLAMVDGNDYAGLLTDIRDKLDWRHRSKSERIQVTICVTSPNVPHEGRYISLDREVQEYIYGDGPSPFHITEGVDGAFVPFGTGIVLDEFDSSFRRTYNGYG
ncbi:hypothetical protein NW768_001024 [Fusarium equiseti]|uniref:F-box domain-containing protein n=1 Tax=Fusarium equiseti TaxID=61235 RepID=A0ABQ8RP30_FUSEQ|nr:hypothetical protein NW768_001024 [Fusarium equiseti]